MYNKFIYNYRLRDITIMTCTMKPVHDLMDKFKFKFKWLNTNHHI